MEPKRHCLSNGSSFDINQDGSKTPTHSNPQSLNSKALKPYPKALKTYTPKALKP